MPILIDTTITLVHCIAQAVRHPRGRVCHRYLNPGKRSMPATPWLVALLVILLGIGSWIVGSLYHIDGLDEAARVMVYSPVSYMFGAATAMKSVRAEAE